MSEPIQRAIDWVIEQARKNVRVEPCAFPDFVLDCATAKNGEAEPLALIVFCVHREIEPYELSQQTKNNQKAQQELAESISYFSLVCALERLKREGKLEDYSTLDIFDLHSPIQYRLSKETWNTITNLTAESPDFLRALLKNSLPPSPS